MKNIYHFTIKGGMDKCKKCNLAIGADNGLLRVDKFFVNRYWMTVTQTRKL
jgi:hypothetical protein